MSKAKRTPAESLDYFLPYQVEWINCAEPIALWEKSRRIGATYTEAYWSVERRVDYGTNHYFSSADLTAAREFIEYCKKWAEVFNIMARDGGEEVIDEKDGVQSFALEFENGARIVAGSSNPKFFRSKGGDATLDEFAFHADAWELYKAAYATAIVWGHRLHILSTHNGEGSYFNRLVGEARKWREHLRVANGDLRMAYSGPRICLHRTTFREAVGQGLAEKVRGDHCGLRISDCGMEEATLQSAIRNPQLVRLREAYIQRVESGYMDAAQRDEELGCTPNSDHSAFLAYELIRLAVAEEVKLVRDPAELGEGPLYAGYDVGRKHDLSVLWVLGRVGDVYWTRMLRALSRWTFSAQEGLLNSLMTNRNVRRLCIDETGMGMQLAERMRERWGSRVEGVTLSAPVKHSLGEAWRDLFVDRRIRIPAAVEVEEGEPLRIADFGLRNGEDQTRRHGGHGRDTEKTLRRAGREDSRKGSPTWLLEDLHKTRKVITAAGNVRLCADSDEGGHADAFWAGALAREAADEVRPALPGSMARKPAGC